MPEPSGSDTAAPVDAEDVRAEPATPRTATVHWSATLTAASSISHNGDTRGTITLLRREKIFTSEGREVHVPIISGNSFRGRLRRIGEELLRDALGYEGQLSLPVAHALRSGGALAKTSLEPLSGARLARLNHLIPHVGVFGCCARGGRTISGCLKVGKIVPHLAEVRHLLGDSALADVPAFRGTQIETYTRHDDSTRHDFVTTVPVGGDGYPIEDEPGPDGGNDAPGPSMLMLYRIETLPAGTRMSTWLRLDRATPLEVAFFGDVLDHYAQFPLIGGRTGRGHGQVLIDLERRVVAGHDQPVDWVNHVKENRDEALAALSELA